MSPCAGKYALGCVNPFDPEVSGVCLPTYPAIRSQKVARTIRGTFAIGTNGVGFVAMAPALASDIPSLYLTGATFTGGDMDIFTGTPTLEAGVSSVNIPGPVAVNALTVAATTNRVAGRVVLAGLKCQYAGSTLNLGGVVTALTEPDHLPLATGSTTCNASAMGGYAEAMRRPEDGKSTMILATVINNHETTFDTAYEMASGAVISSAPLVSPYCGGDAEVVGSVLNFPPMMGILITGATPGSVYTYDAVIHCEYVGRPVAAAITNSESDTKGFESVNSAALRMAGELASKGTTYLQSGAETMTRLLYEANTMANHLTPVTALLGRNPGSSGRSRAIAYGS